MWDDPALTYPAGPSVYLVCIQHHFEMTPEGIVTFLCQLCHFQGEYHGRLVLRTLPDCGHLTPRVRFPVTGLVIPHGEQRVVSAKYDNDPAWAGLL
jgi:hypothetical protein